jgi:hypothetical protein
MKGFFDKILTVWLSVILIPAVSCLCCEISHAEQNNSCCCHEEAGSHSESSNHTGSSKDDSCCGDCLLQTLHKEELALLSEITVKPDESSALSDDSSGSSFISADSSISVAWYSTSDSLQTSFYKPVNSVKSSPYQGRSPPLTV